MTPSRQQISDAIKKQKWDRHSYEYACNAMSPYRYFDIYKKPELIEIFYTLCETKFDRIANFTTFKHLKHP